MASTLAFVEAGGEADETRAEELAQQLDQEQGPARGTRQRVNLGVRPGAELAMYVEQTSPGNFTPCKHTNFNATRVSGVLFLCYLRGQWEPPTAQDQAIYEADPGSKVADDKEDATNMLSLMMSKRYRQAHSDWVGIENFARKHHPKHPFSLWVQWCHDTARQICRAQGSERKELLERASARQNEPMPTSILKSLKQSCLRDVGQTEDYGTPGKPNLIPGQGTLFVHVPECRLPSWGDRWFDSGFNVFVCRRRLPNCVRLCHSVCLLSQVPRPRATRSIFSPQDGCYDG